MLDVEDDNDDFRSWYPAAPLRKLRGGLMTAGLCSLLMGVKVGLGALGRSLGIRVSMDICARCLPSCEPESLWKLATFEICCNFEPTPVAEPFGVGPTSPPEVRRPANLFANASLCDVTTWDRLMLMGTGSE